MMCRAKKNAEITVKNSPNPQTMCGGPSMNPAPIVASPTPKIIIRVGFLSLILTDKIAVKTTYKEVRKAETDGVTDSIPIICKTKPASIMPPKIRPPFQSSFEVRARLASLENGISAINAIKKREQTIAPTTPAEV